MYGRPNTMAAMRIPLWLKIGWTIWVMVWVPVYWKQYGLQNFLFFCDLGNILITLGLWLESPLIFSWQATGLLLFQTLYAVDLAGASGQRHLGVKKPTGSLPCRAGDILPSSDSMVRPRPRSTGVGNPATSRRYSRSSPCSSTARDARVSCPARYHSAFWSD